MIIRVLSTISGCVRQTLSRNITAMSQSKAQKMQEVQCQKPNDAMVWIDLELTGLDLDTCHILEVACLISDKNLNVISDELHFVIHQSDAILDNMSEWCIATHGKTGLTDHSRQSKISVKDAEQLLLAHIKKYTHEKRCFMAGNTVYMDRIFINKYMPSINEYLHYRLIDVSTIKELARMWNPELCYYAPRKTFQHKAIPDIKESINELKYYRRYLFK